MLVICNRYLQSFTQWEMSATNMAPNGKKLSRIEYISTRCLGKNSSMARTENIVNFMLSKSFLRSYSKTSKRLQTSWAVRGRPSLTVRKTTITTRTQKRRERTKKINYYKVHLENRFSKMSTVGNADNVVKYRQYYGKIFDLTSRSLLRCGVL